MCAKDGQNYDPVEGSSQSIPFATDSTKMKSENNDGTSSVSNLGTPHHHRSFRGKQLDNPTRQLGSSREPGFLGLLRNVRSVIDAVMFILSSMVPFRIV